MGRSSVQNERWTGTAATAVASPCCTDEGTRAGWLTFARLALTALLTGAFVHAQLTAGPMWTLLTGQGIYDAPWHAWSGLLLYGIGALIAMRAPGGSYAALEQDRIFRWLKWISVVLGISIVYPAGFHYFYDLPSWMFVAGALLTFVLGVLSLRWCQLLIPFAFCVSLAIGSFLNVPHYTWDITDLRHTLSVIGLLNGTVVATALPILVMRRLPSQHTQRSGNTWITSLQPDRLTLLVLTGFSCTMGYFYAGVGKIAINSSSIWMIDGIRWIWQERLDKFFQLFFHMGCTWLAPSFSPQDVYDVLGNSWIRCSTCSMVLFGELAVILFLLSRRMCIAGLIACQALHLGFAVMCGTYFSHWFFVNLIFIVVFSKTSFNELRKQWTLLERLAITAAAVVLCPLVFHTSVLAWSTDRSQMEIFTWHASPLDVDRGPEASAFVSEPQIDPNQLFPYEKNFQMSWRFESLVKALDRNSSTAPRENQHGLASICYGIREWYKLRMVGEWHEHLPRRLTPQIVERDLRQLLAKYHQRQLDHYALLLPPYYTHMAYNPRLLPSDSALRPEAIHSFVLVRQRLEDDHGSVYLTALPEDLCRVNLLARSASEVRMPPEAQR